MDLRLPGLDGIETTRRSAASAAHVQVRVWSRHRHPCSTANGNAAWRLVAMSSSRSRSARIGSQRAWRGLLNVSFEVQIVARHALRRVRDRRLANRIARGAGSAAESGRRTSQRHRRCGAASTSWRPAIRTSAISPIICAASGRTTTWKPSSGLAEPSPSDLK